MVGIKIQVMISELNRWKWKKLEDFQRNREIVSSRIYKKYGPLHWTTDAINLRKISPYLTPESVILTNRSSFEEYLAEISKKRGH